MVNFTVDDALLSESLAARLDEISACAIYSFRQNGGFDEDSPLQSSTFLVGQRVRIVCKNEKLTVLDIEHIITIGRRLIILSDDCLRKG